MEIEGYKLSFRVKRKRPPTARIVDAANGIIELNARKADKGKYKLSIEHLDHVPIVLNVEVI